MGEWFNGRTAWHGPGDVSPVGYAANAHTDLTVWHFGIQEAVNFSEELQEIFPGCPQIKNGYMYVNEAPGLGVDVNEKIASNISYLKNLITTGYNQEKRWNTSNTLTE